MVPSASSPSFPSPLQPHWDLYPRTYAALRLESPINVDGDLTKEAWQKRPFSEDFDDIRGADDAPPDERPNESCRTRFKAAWDDEHLYISAMIESDMPVIATFTERNSPIYQQDSDFEVFVDPLGTCHGYKELEVNAINTVWNLLLDKPYMDGGAEHSGRVAKPGEEFYYDVTKQKTATRVIDGKLNDPTGGRATWTVETALSFKDLFANVTTDRPFRPGHGVALRINFSRVEHKGEINWTWQPQIAWDPVERRHKGYVNMHLPETWGYIVLSDRDAPTPRDASWPSRLTAMNVYYAQHEYRRKNGKFAGDIGDLKDLVDPDIVGPYQIDIALTSGPGFVVVVLGGNSGMIVSVTQDRKILVEAIDDNLENK